MVGLVSLILKKMLTLGCFCVAVCPLFLVARNPVYSVLLLVITSFLLGGQLLASGLEFVAFVLFLVYVGAVAVLFLFVVMMVNLRASSSAFVTTDLHVWWVIMVAGLLMGRPTNGPVTAEEPIWVFHLSTNLSNLGSVLYLTERSCFVLLVGLILFVAMIASISLTLLSSESYRTQQIYAQVRRPSGTFSFVHSRK